MTRRSCLLIAAVCAAGAPLSAQTDYYNTDAGRPVQIEDARAIEHRGFELQLAPVRLSRRPGGAYAWGIAPELAYGIAPRTQVEVSAPIAFLDGGATRAVSGLAGVNIGVLHSLNAETSIPALAIAADVVLPAGGLGPSRAYPSVKGIMTRTFSAFRVHANAQFTFGDAPTASTGSHLGAAEVSRWLAGVAVDRPIALRSMLLTAEAYARQPLSSNEALEWISGAGVRYQLDPRWALDWGIGKALTGDAKAWYVTAGGAYAFGMPWSAR